MYTVENFKTKKELKEAVASGRPVRYYQPGGFGDVRQNGIVYCEGPHYPAPHTWYAACEVRDGVIVKVR